MYKLCEMYFDSLDTGSIKRRLEEFISFKKYNIVFEDMIDKLFSEENNLDVFEKSINNNEITINKLKYNDDGKIICDDERTVMQFNIKNLIKLEKKYHSTLDSYVITDFTV